VVTPEDARRFRERWALVAERDREELAGQSMSRKLRQTAALMQSVDSMGWRAALSEGDELVWQRWQTLRRRLGACL
jgi:hypothetical protein